MKKYLLIFLFLFGCVQYDPCKDSASLIERYQNRDSSLYGLSDIKETGRRFEVSDVQHLWASYNINSSQLRTLGRSWYAPKEDDLINFLTNATSHLNTPAEDFHCGDYSASLMGERMAMGLWGTCQNEWYMAIVGIISGTLETADMGTVGHSWNWAIIAEHPDRIYFIDILRPVGEYREIGLRTYLYVYDPALHGPLTNASITW
jgi:hypothetical protein